MRLLLIEDDPRLSALLMRGLSESGAAVELARNATEGHRLAAATFDALILDVRLPEGQDAGFELAQRLRAEGCTTPILFLTARADLESRLTGLDLGGDDYLTKPFEFRELRSRLHALVRRSAGQASNLLPLPGGLVLHLSRRDVRLGAQSVPLTPREYDLLSVLALYPQRAYSRDELLLRVWESPDPEPKVVDVYVASLRRKLGEGVIETVRGHGYRLGRLDS